MRLAAARRYGLMTGLRQRPVAATGSASLRRAGLAGSDRTYPGSTGQPSGPRARTNRGTIAPGANPSGLALPLRGRLPAPVEAVPDVRGLGPAARLWPAPPNRSQLPRSD